MLMTEYLSKYEVSDRELARGRNLKAAALAAPVILTTVPAVLFTVLAFVFGTSPPVAFTFFVFGLILTSIGLLGGLGLTGFFLYRHSAWSKEIREKIAADGIKAEEIEWFKNELRSSEKRALKEITRSDLLLADAYRETLASRLTATRIVQSSRRELAMTQRRRAKLGRFKSEQAHKFTEQIDKDIEKINSIHGEAKLMLAEAEARLQMIEAAGVRGRSVADSELALKKLSSRSRELPLALEEMRLTDELSREFERQLEADIDASEFESTLDPGEVKKKEVGE
ncbi:MAG TPA: hypothetical protein PKD26_06185 [Pyrinomonadaceae bacterium]|nr:hypothetical protein [Pyrinomonadaceae bacterium]